MSPTFFTAEPTISISLLFISVATIRARLVFPRPGPPLIRIWETGSFLFFAAPISTDRICLASCWPTNSSSRCGLMVIILVESRDLNDAHSSTRELGSNQAPHIELACGAHLLFTGSHLINIISDSEIMHGRAYTKLRLHRPRPN